MKCPYCDREKIIDNIVQKSSCIEKINNNYILKENHQYFYQIQAQWLLINYKYCDLFLWTKIDNIRIRTAPHDTVQMKIVEMSKKVFPESYTTRTFVSCVLYKRRKFYFSFK